MNNIDLLTLINIDAEKYVLNGVKYLMFYNLQYL